MSPTSQSTPSSSGRSPEEQFRVVRKRNRVPLSCYPCRTKKKCDRGHPCSNCVKRDGDSASTCTYAAPVNRKKNQAASASPDDMQNRIDRLENLVLSLMHTGNGVDAATAASAASIVPGVSAANSVSRTDSISSAPKDTGSSQPQDDMDDESDVDDGLATSLGVLKVDTDRGKSMYIGQEHWHTILSDIAEVKNYFVMHRKDLEKSYERVLQSKPATAREAPTFLLGAEATTEGDLRAELPPKSTVLTLCGRYFNSMDNAVNIIHAPTFNAQLRSHWQNPSKTPIMWLGLLYSVMCLAMLSYHKVGDEPPEWKGHAMELASLFRVRTVQCLTTADYTKPVEYTVETMILYVFGEYSSRWDADLGLWLIGSLITRVAFRMGYHRDAKWFPSITPFQAEMRRRTWALVRMCDVMFSHQVSLPNMIYDHDCDTQLPLNIFDEEFGPNTKVLPPSRPNSEPTPIAYMIAKVKLCLELGNILQATTRVGKPVPYEEILRYDARLREIKEEIPSHLKLQPLEGSQDPLTLIIARFNIDSLYQKIMCLLHRKYLSRARQNPRYAHSRRSAIEASMETLHHLQTLNKESQANGRLRSIKWYVASIATKDFLLPAMLVALEVRYDNLASKDGQEEDGFWTREQRADMINMLTSTKEIWRPLADGSMEAYKAYNIIRIVLEKIGTTPTTGPRPTEAFVTSGVCSVDPPSATKSTPSDNSVQVDTPLTDPVMDQTDMMAPLNMMSGTIPGFESASTTTSPSTAANTAAINTAATNSMFGSMPAPGGTAFNTIDPTLSAAIDGGLTATDLNGDMMSSMAGFNMFSQAMGSGVPNIMDDAMDFTTNFDWSGPFAAGDQTFQFFSSTDQPLGTNVASDGTGNTFNYSGTDMPGSGPST
ncbi:C6 transcription factor [Sporothrix brasiliensis 5110]|uniref:C6 transcription factor n=1 Tax=Sporothrix brasiliensis 5110 TaxID=1398154 RepID=A0A0C2IU12_9PEZI|nr:C6 transcription factor [Sporothrix brasiliensis 5110]KIH90260.1 C6 transcription factor [Sporothrix brasiliensis 5110]